jgi:tRNA (guanosine-2'-O-)-methyltransferase
MLDLYPMNATSQNLLLKSYGAEHIIAQLYPYISPRRRERIHQVLDQRLTSVQVALEMPADIHNAFAVIRSSEIFGVATMHIIAPEKIVSGMRAISKGAMDWVEIKFYHEISDFLQEMRRQNCRLAGAIPTATQNVGSIPITEPLCLLLGNEHSGLSTAAQQACDWQYQIPMFGMTKSLNLSVAAAVSLYEITQRKRQHLSGHGDLNPATRNILQAQYYLNSVNARLINALFPGQIDGDRQ